MFMLSLWALSEAKYKPTCTYNVYKMVICLLLVLLLVLNAANFASDFHLSPLVCFNQANFTLTFYYLKFCNPSLEDLGVIKKKKSGLVSEHQLVHSRKKQTPTSMTSVFTNVQLLWNTPSRYTRTRNVQLTSSWSLFSRRKTMCR